MSAAQNFLEINIKLFHYYKDLADKAMTGLPDEALHSRPNETSNNIAILVKHMSGNMLSRFTDFLTTDGEKTWRDREGEFVDTYTSREALVADWEKGWNCLFDTLATLSEAQVNDIVYIRNEGHTVVAAIARQLAHYSYHVGQIVYLAKAARDKAWVSLSIPVGGTAAFNQEKFDKEQQSKFFTDK